MASAWLQQIAESAEDARMILVSPWHRFATVNRSAPEAVILPPWEQMKVQVRQRVSVDLVVQLVWP